jgi:hypothetical protein
VIQAVAVGERNHFIDVQTASGVESRAIRFYYAPSVDAFLANNPNCCRVGSFDSDAPPPEQSLLARVFKPSAEWVSIRYTHFEVEGDRVGGRYVDGRYRVIEDLVTRQYKVSSCGRVIFLTVGEDRFMTGPTPTTIMNLYLYGQTTTPENLTTADLIRGEGTGASVEIDVVEYMTTGAGRFATGAQFALISSFFNAPAGLVPVGTYSKEEMAEFFNYDYYGLEIAQYNYDDGAGDRAERTFIYNNGAFEIADGTEFVVLPTGEKQLENFAIEPIGDENFDFSSSEGLASRT